MQKLTSINASDSEEQWLSIGQAAEILGVSVDTLRRWEKAKKIKAYRSPSNRRIYHRDELSHIYASSTPQLEPLPAPITKPIENVEPIASPSFAPPPPISGSSTFSVPTQPQTETPVPTALPAELPETNSITFDPSSPISAPTVLPPISVFNSKPITTPELISSTPPHIPQTVTSPQATSKNIQVLKTISIILSVLLIILGVIITILVFI